MNKMKRFLSIILSLALIFSISACSTKSSTENSTASQSVATESVAALVTEAEKVTDTANYQFAVVYGGVHPFFDAWEPGAKAAAKDLGIPEPYVLSPQKWDQTEQ